MGHRGKIGFHFPTRSGAVNFDAVDIKFMPHGGSANDLKRVLKVFHVPHGLAPASLTVNNLDNYRVWQYMELIGQSRSVAIEFVPKTNITVSSIGIFSSENSTGRSPRIKIFHETGLCVAAADGDTQTPSVTKYDLFGSRHTAQIPPTTLYAGQRYYISYSHGYGSGNDFFPAYLRYYDGAYKEYENENSASQMTIIDLNTMGISHCKGIVDDSSAIFRMSEDDWFCWMGSTQTGMTQGYVYVRSSVGTQYNFTGAIGDPNSYHELTTADLMAFLGRPLNGEFIWYVDNVANMQRGEIWAKTTDTSNFNTIDLSSYSNQSYATAVLLYDLQSKPEVMCTAGSFWYSPAIGKSFKLAPGYYNGVTSTTPETSLPANPQNNTLYYLDGQAIGQPIGYQTGVFVYNNGSYTQVLESNYSTFFAIETLDSLMTKVGTNSDLIKTEISTGDPNLPKASTTTGTKFYLELNGNEV